MHRYRKVLSIALLVFVSARCSSGAQDAKSDDSGFTLSPGIEKRILSEKNVRRILQVKGVQSHVLCYATKSGTEGYVLVAVEVSLEGDFGMEGGFHEGIWHGEILLARKCSEPNWEKAIKFSLPRDLAFKNLDVLSPTEFEENVLKQKPNQSVQPTPGAVTPRAKESKAK